MISKSEILAEIKRCASENGGRPVGSRQFARETGISERYWKGIYWARWNDAVTEAGLTPNKMRTEIYSDEDVLRRVSELAVSIGHLPNQAELRLKKRSDPEFPGEDVFSRRFGGRNRLLERLSDFASTHAEFSSVYDMCAPHLTGVSPPPGGAKRSADPSVGYVYLIRMDKWHKVGATKDILRRQGEIRLTLPAKEVLVHTIETDDPFGVESYWKKRFSDRQTKSEWFILSPADVKAFKRWRRIY
ncbi:MAG TPA: GIY-YIG nuclease family protein [Acidimicrobiales bacterium]|nr:GIY-YIG nuclease family protein [Acidimicrobiales bacterium]